MTDYQFSTEEVSQVLLTYATPSTPPADNDSGVGRLFNLLLGVGRIIPIGNMFYISSPGVSVFVSAGQLGEDFLNKLNARSPLLFNEVLHIVNDTALGKMLVFSHDLYEQKVKRIRASAESSVDIGLPRELISEYVQPRLTELATSFNSTYLGIVRGVTPYTPPAPDADQNSDEFSPPDPEYKLTGAIGVLVEDIEALG